MKALLVGEYREGKLLGSTYELVAFAEKLGAQAALFLVGRENDLPCFNGAVYLADAGKHGEFSPEAHKQLLLEVIKKENPDIVVLSHSSYGWDLAPRLALALKAAQVSEVVDYRDGALVVPVCNAKLRRSVRPKTPVSVVTLQNGAFPLGGEPTGTPALERIDIDTPGNLQFVGYEVAEKGEVDLTKAEVIVSAGRGIGKPENLQMIVQLAKAMGGEFGASRPVVDAGWTEHNRQVGSTGQAVSPKLYLACGISGSIQHMAGMKKSEFVVAINTDKDAPIGEIANVLVVADLKHFVPMLTEKLLSL
jgi:electron transfer flavoprotein alpha subunit